MTHTPDEQKQQINHVEMTLTCDACEHNLENCKIAWEDGTCKLHQPEDPKT